MQSWCLIYHTGLRRREPAGKRLQYLPYGRSALAEYRLQGQVAGALCRVRPDPPVWLREFMQPVCMYLWLATARSGHARCPRQEQGDIGAPVQLADSQGCRRWPAAGHRPGQGELQRSGASSACGQWAVFCFRREPGSTTELVYLSKISRDVVNNSGDFAEEEGQVEAIFDLQLPEYGAQVCLDGTLGYIELTGNHLVVAAEMHHACNLQFTWCQGADQ